MPEVLVQMTVSYFGPIAWSIALSFSIALAVLLVLTINLYRAYSVVPAELRMPYRLLLYSHVSWTLALVFALCATLPLLPLLVSVDPETPIISLHPAFDCFMGLFNACWVLAGMLLFLYASERYHGGLRPKRDFVVALIAIASLIFGLLPHANWSKLFAREVIVWYKTSSLAVALTVLTYFAALLWIYFPLARRKTSVHELEMRARISALQFAVVLLFLSTVLLAAGIGAFSTAPYLIRQPPYYSYVTLVLSSCTLMLGLCFMYGGVLGKRVLLKPWMRG